jgi:hypothetical protein
MLRRLIAAGCLVAASTTTAFASAQAGDYTGQVQSTLAANELLVQQIRAAMPSSDLDVMSQQAAVTQGVGEELEQELSQALASAPDDASRSRIEGILTHTQAAVASLKQAQVETTLDAIHGRLDQARGEALEGLDELQPLVGGLARPAELPTAGSLGGPELDALPVLGVFLVLVGLVLRRGAPSRWTD